MKTFIFLNEEKNKLLWIKNILENFAKRMSIHFYN